MPHNLRLGKSTSNNQRVVDNAIHVAAWKFYCVYLSEERGSWVQHNNQC